MESAVKILKLLLSNKEKRFTIKKIAENTDINYRIAYENVLQLEKGGFIKITKSGNAKACEFTNKFNPKVFNAEYERRIDLFKNKDFLVLQRMLHELEFPLIALLFGSQAKKMANRQSDIDILAVGNHGTEIETALSLWPKKIHLTSVTYKDFIHMARSKEFNVVNEAIKNNIILIGIEEYYRLLSNA